MKNILRVASVVMGVMVAGSTLYAADASVSLDVASAYVFRGATLNDGTVLQPGLEVSGLGGLSIGTWANLDIDDYNNTLASSQFSEVDLYGSYAIPIKVMDLSIGYTEYTYPSGGGDSDREFGLNAGISAAGMDLGAGVFYGVDGGIKDSAYAELSIGKDIELADDLGLSAGATLGYASPDEGKDGLSHYTGTLGLSYKVVSASVTYVGQIDDKVLPDGPGAYDVDVFGTLGVSLDW